MYTEPFPPQISTNGLVSFGSSSDDFPVDRNEFPDLDRFLVAPYWADFDLRIKGRIAYEIFASPSSSVVQAVNKFLADNQTLVFSGSWALLASWEDTCRFGDRECTVTKVQCCSSVASRSMCSYSSA